MSKVRVLISNTHNPWFNLATEEWIFREMDSGFQTLFLWRNDQTVVIGRNQNPWSECNLAKMEADGVTLARRTSGGGAVFHDLGNTCFTFLSPREGYDRSENNAILLEALKAFGVKAEASGRNDVIVLMEDGPRKVSGSAFRETRERCFHHGTFLIRTNMTRLANYLTPHPKKLESKGRASVRSRVMNLTEVAPQIEHETLSKALIEAFFAHHGERCEPEVLDPANLQTYPSLQETYQKYSSWDWRFGHAPQFSQQMTEYFPWGLVEAHLNAKGARIDDARLFSDALFPDLIEDFEKALKGQPFTRAGMQAAGDTTEKLHPLLKEELAQLVKWLKSQVEV